jgi:excisionase family DNA binding protein
VTEQQALAQQIAALVIEALAQPRLASPALLERDTRPLLSMKAAAERLGVTDRSVFHLVERGEIPSIQVGKARRLIEPAAIEEYIDRQRSVRGWHGARAGAK